MGLNLNSPYKYISKDWEKTIIINFYLLLMSIIPLFGVLALLGILLRLIKANYKNDKKEFKVFGTFWEDVKNGFKLLLINSLILILIGLLMFILTYSCIYLINDNYSIINILLLIGVIIIDLIIPIFFLILMNIIMIMFAISKTKKFKELFMFKKAYLILKKNLKSYLKMIGIIFCYTLLLFFIYFLILLIGDILTYFGIGIGVNIIGIISLFKYVIFLILGFVYGNWFKNIKNKKLLN